MKLHYSKSNLTRGGLLAVLGLFAVTPAFAAGPAPQATAAPEVEASPTPEETPDGKNAKKEKEEKVVKGVIASNGRYSQFASVAVNTEGSSPGDEGGVISGSVNFVKEGLCRAVVMNNGEKSYSVYFAVIGTNARGTKVFSNTGSGIVAPKQKLEKDVTGCRKDLNLALELRSAKALKN